MPAIETDRTLHRFRTKRKRLNRQYDMPCMPWAGGALEWPRSPATLNGRMNVHHLELFYYVARFGGISEAVRNIPYGIQQPAVSSQIIQLEEFLGVTLFQRRPFELTPAGDELYKFIAPFFGNLDRITEKLQGGTAHSIRVGASEVILRDHLPALVQEVRKKFPKLKMVLREGYQPQLEQWIDRQEIDLAFTLLSQKGPGNSKAQRLLELPLVLLVEKSSKVHSPDDLW